MKIDHFKYSDKAYQKKLAIVVPYRDREKHLQAFLPHMLKYFNQSTYDKNIRYSIHFVEQKNNKPFNRGILMNAGYHITKNENDYHCFHDIDYLPVWANYAYPESPTRLIWYGLVPVPPSNFFGGVSLFQKKHFEMINGYPNSYWGWGYEDTEVYERCIVAGLTPVSREGTYQALPHKSNGFKSIESLEFNDVAQKNRKHFGSRVEHLDKIIKQEGLSSLSFNHISSKNIIFENKNFSNLHFHQIDF